MSRRLTCLLIKRYSVLSCRQSSGLAVEKESIVKDSPPDVQEDASVEPKNGKKQLYAWGLAELGALGLEKFNNNHFKKTPKYKHKPTRHCFGENHHVTHVTCGYGFSAFAVKTRADVFKVYGCGVNTDSQVGCHEPRKGFPLGIVIAPVPINLGIQDCTTDVLSISAGRAHLVVVTDKEGVFTLGSNCYGQCGRPIIQDEKYSGSSFVHNIKLLDNYRIWSVVCGQDHTLMLNNEGKVFACGWGADGQTGLGTDDNVSCPTKLQGDITDECIVKMVGNCDTVLVLSNKGEVFGWGNTEYLQLTNENDDVSAIKCPRYVDKFKCVGKVVDIAAGGSFCMVLNEEGDVFVWGYGILGAGPNVDKAVIPIPLPRSLFGCNQFQPDSRVISISCGLSHMAAVTNYGNLYTWGRNRKGCLGIGHIRDQYFPYKVCIGAQVNHVSCGVDHTMALCTPFI